MTNEIKLLEVYSILFLVVAFIYLLLGVYVLTLNINKSLNRIFFATCTTLGLWAYSYSFANSAPTYEVAFFWHRISVLGWGLMYSVLLHYFLILTERTNFLKTKFAYALLYGPALLNVFVFGLYAPTATSEYNLIQTLAGWVNVSENGFFDWYFYLYYLAFSIMSLLSLWTWKRIKNDNNIKRVVQLISISVGISIGIGTITDVVLRLYSQDIKPQLGVIFAVIPIVTTFYTVKKYNLMINRNREVIVESNQILNESIRLLFYKYLSIAYFTASIFILFEIVIYRTNSLSVLFMSSTMFLVGLCVFALPHLTFSVITQDILLSFMVSGTAPFVLLYYMTHPSNNMIWVTPFLLMIIATIFNRRLMLVLTVISAVFTQLWIWARYPDTMVTITSADYMSRILIILIVSAMVLFINRLYQKRLEENEEKTNLQKLMSQISAELVSVNIDNLDDKLNLILKCNGEFFSVDRTYLFQSSKDHTTTTYTHEWCVHWVVPAIDQIGTLPMESFPWWIEQLNAHEMLIISDVACMPEEARSERALLEAQKVKSLIILPLINKKKVIGFLGFESVENVKIWKESHKEVLPIIGNVISDALSKVNAEKEINYMAYYDSLTGLANRMLFKKHLEKAIALASRSEKLVGILFLDLDAFKSINDTMGHEAGDLLLKEIARRLSQRVRRYDTVCRFGGDEFLVMFPQLETQEQLKQAGDKVMSLFKEPVIINEQTFYMTASAGFSVWPVDGQDSETLIKSADLAMYASKEQGKNQITFCSSIMKEAVKEKMQLTNELYRALERNELLLYYQPQIQIETGKIVGLEALIRWQHPERGMVSPVNFIPLAEQTGLIHPIGEWVLRTACRQNKEWQDKGLAPIVMAVNLSIEQFRTPHLTKIVANVLKETGLSPEYLELEITEGIAIKEPAYILPILNNLKAQGIAISIDDFGTEYSSLSRLKELPIDRIKMAMEFVQSIDKGEKDKSIAMVIINLAKSLGLRVIAEGVETVGQLEFLAKGVCDEVQGYYFHHPMPAEEIEKIMWKG